MKVAAMMPLLRHLRAILLLPGIAAVASARRCLVLLPKGHPGHAQAAKMAAHFDRLIALESKLDALAQGKFPLADFDAKLDAAYLCQHRRFPRTGVRLYTEAFNQNPDLVKDLKAGRRFLAACAAAQTATGQGKDADKLEEKERALLRRQVLTWLRGKLSGWGEVVAQGPASVRRATQFRLRSWLGETRLAALREPAAVLHLPADERAALAALWVDVAALLATAARNYVKGRPLKIHFTSGHTTHTHTSMPKGPSPKISFHFTPGHTHTSMNLPAHIGDGVPG